MFAYFQYFLKVWKLLRKKIKIFKSYLKKSIYFNSYFLAGWFVSEIVQCIIVIVCTAFDFYVVKNICGRKLVGLRLF